ncbi:CDP-alcohol phosphatidyltransferase family protein [Tindallia californiensis]|uniref:CDP-diacylglycerol--serine O-phosphatidyltransferase n=1 Tax=Tindallia californiensis TaxID=159292 RepID=A0A1H3IQH1_9FIRM|nr:CDP-alcohol phosphatidyltransferase family protein [Tindallia californiensis]SDY29952.1 CDP-diacylglycerol--serine O-phosphatidyltransferase [Tindallia californiensis]
MKLKSNLPNMVTFLNLTLGLLAIVCIIGERYLLSASLIILAALTDRFDGSLARKLDVESELGKELDSLCDLISFGVAPAVLMWSFHLADIGVAGFVIMVIFAISGAYRLAFFNIMEFDGVYMGFPITMCGGIVALMAIYSVNYTTNIYVLGFIMILLSYAMVSKRIKLKKR